MRYSTILISTFAALSLSLTINQTVHTEEIETAKWTETKWANVNRITFQDEFSSFNSGVAKLRKGQTATIKAKIDYSGDLAPILQSAVTFENVDTALSIGYDENTLTIQHKQAIFTFTVTLNQDLLKPALFTVKVSDGRRIVSGRQLSKIQLSTQEEILLKNQQINQKMKISQKYRLQKIQTENRNRK